MQGTSGAPNLSENEEIIANRDRNIIKIQEEIRGYLLNNTFDYEYSRATFRLMDINLKNFLGENREVVYFLSKKLRTKFILSIINAANSLDYFQLTSFINCQNFHNACDILNDPKKYRMENEDEYSYISDILDLKRNFNTFSQFIYDNFNKGALVLIITGIICYIIGIFFDIYNSRNENSTISTMSSTWKYVIPAVLGVISIPSTHVSSRVANNQAMFDISKKIFTLRKEGMDKFQDLEIPRDKFKLKTKPE